MERKKADPALWAIWGAFCGAFLSLVATGLQVGFGDDAGLVAGPFIAGAIGGTFLGAIAAFIRNRFIR